MTLQRKLLAIFIATTFGFGSALAQDSDPPPPDDQTTPPVQSETDTSVEAEAGINSVAADRLVSSHAETLGSEDNARSLVTSLRTGGSASFSQETTAEDGTITITTTEFQPATGPMGFGEIDNALALAEADLAAAGITEPTLDDLALALNGGSLVDAEGNTVEFSGVLQMRSEGMGWGQIANTLGFRLGEVKGSARAEVAAEARAARALERISAARVDRPLKPERLDKPERPTKPERPERPDRGGRPGG